MAYVTFLRGGTSHVGELDGELVVPVEGFSEIGLGTPGDALDAARRLRSHGRPLAEVELLPVVPNPGKIFCVGLNYHSHIEETKRDLPTYPVLFPKYASSLIGAGAPIMLPAESEQVDYEAELAVVIGLPGRRIPEADALQHILGYTIANDVTVRDYQYKTHQWLQGKAWDRTTPLGPALYRPDEVDVSAARITTVLNGETLQDSDLSFLIYSIPNLIATISTFTMLQAGDVILTGTPSGVGFRRDPQVFLRDGDEITVEIEGLGKLTNPVTAEQKA